MKQSNKILTVILAFAFARGAQANVNSNEVVNTNAEQEVTSLDEIQALLEQLVTAKALEVDEAGHLRVKPSVLETLRNQGRLSVQSASFSSICN